MKLQSRAGLDYARLLRLIETIPEGGTAIPCRVAVFVSGRLHQYVGNTRGARHFLAVLEAEYQTPATDTEAQ